MKIEDYDIFCELWMATHEGMAGGKKLSGIALEMIFEDLEDYDFELVKQCVKRHRKTAQFAPTVFDITTMIKELCGVEKHLGIEEAWVLGQALLDESNTVIVTNEIFEAFAVASQTDKYSQAKAFKEKYGELIKYAGMPEWTVKYGAKRITGGYPEPARLINPERANQLSTSLRIELNNTLALTNQKPTTTVAKLISEASEKSNVIDAAHRFAELKDIFNRAPDKSKADLAKEHEALCRAKHQEAIKQLLAENPHAFDKPAVELIEDSQEMVGA